MRKINILLDFKWNYRLWGHVLTWQQIQFFCICNISKRKQTSTRKHTEQCLTHLNKTACEVWSGLDKVHFCVKLLTPFFHRTLQINEVKLMETQLTKFAFQSTPFIKRRFHMCIPALALLGRSCNARRQFLKIETGPASGDISVTESLVIPPWSLSVLLILICKRHVSLRIHYLDRVTVWNIIIINIEMIV